LPAFFQKNSNLLPITLYDKYYKKSFFLKKSYKKALQQIAKGLEIVSSPYWTRSELFVGVKRLPVSAINPI
jgi:hypothetical protein